MERSVIYAKMAFMHSRTSAKNVKLQCAPNVLSMTTACYVTQDTGTYLANVIILGSENNIIMLSQNIINILSINHFYDDMLIFIYYN